MTPGTGTHGHMPRHSSPDGTTRSTWADGMTLGTTATTAGTEDGTVAGTALGTDHIIAAGTGDGTLIGTTTIIITTLLTIMDLHT